MVRRDRISELIARRERSGRRGGRFPDLKDLADLQDAFDNYTGPKELLASLLPARIVTLLEVFCRYWIQIMIDHGTPYDERAINLKADVKYDLALVRSLQGKSITLGLLLSNSVKLTSLETIAAVFSDLIQADFFEWLSKLRERFSIEHDGDKAVPLIQDLEKTN